MCKSSAKMSSYVDVMFWLNLGWNFEELMLKFGSVESARIWAEFLLNFLPTLRYLERCGGVASHVLICACKVFGEISKRNSCMNLSNIVKDIVWERKELMLKGCIRLDQV